MGDPGITSQLDELGLSPDYWGKVFRDELGVSSKQALSLVGGESYPILAQFVRHAWEKKVLRALLKIEEEQNLFEKQRSTQRERLHNRYKQSSDILQTLKVENSKGKNRTDETVQALESAFREMYQVPIASWIPTDKSLTELISQIQHLHDKLSEQLKPKDEANAASLLKKASGGRAMQGILFSKKLEDQLADRCHLLNIPYNVQLMGMSHSQNDIVQQFSSENQEDSFSKTVEMLGYSAGISAKDGSFFGISVEVGASIGRSAKTGPSSSQQKQQLYHSTVKYSCMPLASFVFTDSQLVLSDEAIKDLQGIMEVIAVYKPGSPNTQQTCEKFFRKFGSHVSRGPLHFGGIYWLKCSSKGLCNSEMSDVQQLQSDAVNVNFGISHVFGVGISFGVDATQVKDKYKGRCSEQTISKTEMKITKLGGPLEVSTMAEWKAGLIASNSDWYLIDRGTDFIPMWEIVQMNHGKQFKNVKVLVHTLKTCWEKMTTLSAKPNANNSSYNPSDVIKVVSSWNTSIGSLLQCNLQYLIDVKEDLIKESMDTKAWPSLYLSEPPIQKFLKSVIDQQPTDSSTSEYVKLQMQQLVEKSDLNTLDSSTFPQKAHFSQWLYGQYLQQQSLLPLECKDFLSFGNYLETASNNVKEAKARSFSSIFSMSTPTSKPQYTSVATLAVSRALNSFHKNLQDCKQVYEELFLITLIYPFVLNESSYKPIILKQLSSDDLEYLCELLPKKCEVFFKYKNKSLKRVQTFLFHMAVEIYEDEAKLDVDVYQVVNHLKYMEKRMGDSIDLALTNILAKASADWDQLLIDLYSLLTVEQSQQQLSGHSITDVLSKTKTIETHSAKSNGPAAASIQSTNAKKNLCTEHNTKAKELFSLLHLMKFYPQKLTSSHALCIREETLEMEKCTDPSNLYLFVLQKIMAYDCHCRANLLITSSSVTAKSSKTDELFGDDSDEESDKTSTIKIHPMDSILALLHCADDFLRQDLMARLVDCQLSIPLLLPDPFTKQLTFPLWAMRSIVKEWKSKVGKTVSTHEVPLVSYRSPIVSFVRFNYKSQISKSKMMNNVISDSNQNHFFHQDCEGGNIDGLLGDGLVELCWYLPTGKSADVFPDVITFLNLHGNGLDHPKQIAFLSEISFMIFVIFVESDLTDESTKVLQTLSKAPGGIVMLLCGSGRGKTSKLKQLSKTIPDKLQGLKLSDRNADEIKKEIRSKINEKLQKSSANGKALEECVKLASKYEIVTDESKQDFIEGQRLASALKEMLIEHDDKDISAKEKMLPLQGENLWQKWAKQDKEEHRHLNKGSMRVEDYTSRKLKEKRQIRQLQLQHVHNLSPFMESFIVSLLTTSGSTRNYFLQCLKLYLNNLSRNTIAVWQEEYKEKRSKLLASQKSKRTDTKVVKEMEHLHKTIINASLGLENVLRELGQVYEAIQESQSPKKEEYSRLPKVAAELLIAGYPLELMDGDAAHVPKTWVSAVMKEALTLLNDPHLFVLSVLGQQSTGKSTLINTTFGLQFNVGAGRCTRGAFMQLLPISNELKKELKYDYVLVVDTEGLCAPELDSQKMQQHDNELATFVIGIANVTVINIYGETPGNMDDILQTAVHAFIRMKNVNSHFNPSCQFVHQNVASVGASNKGGMNRSKFKDKLDKMTFEAAKEEAREGEFQYFNEVIRFDEEKDVHHFPGLWRGDPPMAPVNPGYSERAIALRSHLIKKVETSCCKFSDVNTLIRDLWNALLHEKFVFSFKNTLELSVYTSLEAKYVQWSWSFRSKMLEWEQAAGNKILNSNPKQYRILQAELITNELNKVVMENYEAIQKEMLKFFEESDQREMLAQWQVETMNRLKRLSRELQEHAKGSCCELMSSQQALENFHRMGTNYKEQLLEKVKALVDMQQREELDKLSKPQLQEKLKEIFDDGWLGWLQELQQKAPVRREFDVDVETSVEQSLIDFFRNEDSVTKQLMSKPLKQWGKCLYLQVTEEYVTSKQYSFYNELNRVFFKPGPVLQAKHRKQAQETTEYVFSKVLGYLQSEKGQNFNPTFTYQLLVTVKQAIEEFSQEHKEMMYKKQYNVAMSLTVCGYAMPKFKKMRDEFVKQHDPIEYLQREMKEPLYILFENLFFQIAGEKAAAYTFCGLLKNSIKSQILMSLGSVIFLDMRSLDYLSNKSALTAKILTDLGEDLQHSTEHDVKYYFLYLETPTESFRYQLKKYAIAHCGPKGKNSRLTNLAHRQLKALVLNVGTQVQNVSEEFHVQEIETKEWVSNFRNKITSELDVTVFKGFEELGGITELKDIQNFTKQVLLGLQTLQQELFSDFETLTLEELKQQPDELLFEQLCAHGCKEQCPFCGELCHCGDANHTPGVKHTVLQHRPQVLGGYIWPASNEIITDVCSSLVGGKRKFKANNKWVEYRKYQKIYQHWSIPVDRSAKTSLYWKWFVGNYSQKIAKYCGSEVKATCVPKNWKTITWEQAKQELKNAYKI